MKKLCFPALLLALTILTSLLSMPAAAMGFAAGIMIAASFFSLLLPAMEGAAEGGKANAALVLTVGFLAGCAFVMLADLFLSGTEKFSGEGKRGSTLMCAAMTLHNVPEGFAVGVAFGSAARWRLRSCSRSA